MQCSYPSCQKKLSPTTELNVSCPYCRTYTYCSPTCRQLHWDISHKIACTGYSTSAIPSTSSALDTSNASSEASKKKQKTVDDFEVINQPNKSNADLGKGSFGQVKLVRDKTDPTKQYAMKVINKKQLMQFSGLDYLKREIKIQKKLDHPHIVKLYHYFEDSNNVYLVLEYAKNGNLFFYLRKKKVLTEKEAFIYFFQTCVGIDYLHKKGILHRDLKPENLLLDATGNIKVCDFGWSAEDVGKRNTFCGTVDYMAPEMVQNKAHDFKIDIWSLGVLLFELLHGYPPFRGKTADEKFRSILEKELKFKDGLSNEVKDLVSALLRSEPSVRPGFDYIFNHNWIQKFEKEFGMNVKSFIYDPSKKKEKDKNKSGNVTPRSQSPINLPTTPTSAIPKEITAPRPLTPTHVEKGFPLSIDTNAGSKSPTNYSTHSPKMEYKPQISPTPFSTTSIVSSINHVPTSPARSRNNLEDPFNQLNAQPTSPMRGVNKAQELVQSIFQPPSPRNQSKSPPRSGIFSPQKQYEGPQQVNKALVGDPTHKRNTTNENPLGIVPGSSSDLSKRKTTNDISVTGQPDRTNKFMQDNYALPSSMNNISGSPHAQKQIIGTSPFPKIERSNSDNSLAFNKPATPGQSFNTHSKSPSRDFTAQASKADPNTLKKTIDDDVPDIKESTKKENFQFGHKHISTNLPTTTEKNYNPFGTTTDASKSPRGDPQGIKYPDYSAKNVPSGDRSPRSQAPGGYLDNFQQQPSKPLTPKAPEHIKTTEFKHPDVYNLTNISNPASNQYVSSTSHFSDYNQPPKSPGRSFETKVPDIMSEPKKLDISKPAPPQDYVSTAQQHQYHTDHHKLQQTASSNNIDRRGERSGYEEKRRVPEQKQEIRQEVQGDFFVPKGENIDKMFNKAEPQNWLTQNSQFTPASQDSDPVRFTRVTNLLEKGHLSEVDQIMEKMLQEGREKDPGRRTQNQTRSKSPNNDHGRVTNIDKYIANYDLEDTEENKLLDMLDGYYTTGKLAENDDNTRYPKKKVEASKNEPKTNVEESIGEMSFQVDAPGPLRGFEGKQGDNTSKSNRSRHEMSFQEENSQRFDDKKAKAELSFADMSIDEESPIDKGSRSQKSNNQKTPKHTQHIQEEEEEHEEEDDYYGQKARDRRGQERNNMIDKSPRNQQESKKAAVAQQKDYDEEDDDYYNHKSRDQRGQPQEPKRAPAQQQNHYEDEEEEYQQRNWNQGKENTRKQDVSPGKGRNGVSFVDEEEQERIAYEKEKAMRTPSNNRTQQYKEQTPTEYDRRDGQNRNQNGTSYDKKVKAESSSFIVRMAEKERSEPTSNRPKNYNTQNDMSRKPNVKPGSNLEHQRENLLKNYRDKLNGLYGLNSTSNITMPGTENNDYEEDEQERFYENESRNKQGKKPYKGQNPYDDEEEEEDNDSRYGRRRNERRGEKEAQYDKDPKNRYKKKNNDWPEEYERDARYGDQEADYYQNKLAMSHNKSMSESYNDMKKRKQRIDNYMDDLDVDDYGTVSRPSWKNMREIPKYQEQQEKDTGILSKITSLFGCLERTEKNPPQKAQKTRKGKRVY